MMLRSFKVSVHNVLRIIRKVDDNIFASRIFASTSNFLKQN